MCTPLYTHYPSLPLSCSATRKLALNDTYFYRTIRRKKGGSTLLFCHPCHIHSYSGLGFFLLSFFSASMHAGHRSSRPATPFRGLAQFHHLAGARVAPRAADRTGMLTHTGGRGRCSVTARWGVCAPRLPTTERPAGLSGRASLFYAIQFSKSLTRYVAFVTGSVWFGALSS